MTDGLRAGVRSARWCWIGWQKLFLEREEVGRLVLLRGILVLTLLCALLASSRVNGQAGVEQGGHARIVNVHEHLQSMAAIGPLLAAMDAVAIEKTVLLGSPSFTFTLNPRTGFAGYAANNEVVLGAAARHPDRFYAWPTIDPRDLGKLDKLRDYLRAGATGLKLYLGHGYRDPESSGYVFHKMAMDGPGMSAIYEYVEANNIPVMYHVNPGPTKPGFAEEFISVLKQFPNMKVIAPHFILSSIRDTRLREFLDTFPNLYSDISFGRDPYLAAGLRRISKNPEKFRRLFQDYPARFMFGTDVVVTESELRTEGWLAERFRAYIDMLSKREYQAVIGRTLHLKGLALPRDLRDRILFGNFEAFMASKPSRTQITRTVDWARMGIEKSRTAAAEKAATPEEKEWARLEKEALEGASPERRLKAVDELGRKENEKRALSILTEVLEKDPVPEVRSNALLAIEFFEPVPRAPVLDRLVSDPSPALRMHAMEIVEDEEWQDAEIEHALTRATEDSDDEVRSQAVMLLAEIEAWEALKKISREHRYDKVRRLAVEQLEDR